MTAPHFTKSLAPLVAMSLLGLPSLAEAKFIFPYNHPDLDWYTITTEHFFVHYPVSKKTRDQGNKHYISGEWSARKTAKVAEEMWEPMCAEFDYYMREKIHIVILEQSDELQGFTIPAWDWVEVSANPGSTFYRSRGRMEWFSDVLVHEFAHVVSLKKNSPIAEGTQAVVFGGLYQDGINDQQTGASFVIGDNDPWWWTEGGAEYWSDQAGYNWWTGSRDQTIRTTVLEDRLLTYDEWGTRIQSLNWGDGERGYQQGYSIALYLRQRFGEKTFNEFANASNDRMFLNWEKVIEDVTGVKARQLYDDWKAYLTDHYGKMYDDVKAAGEVKGKQLETRQLDWESNDPDTIDKWYTDKKQRFRDRQKRKRDRESDKQGTGTWEFYPRTSSDGRWLAQHVRGRLVVTQRGEHHYPAASGGNPGRKELADESLRAADMTGRYPITFGDQYDWIPGRDALVGVVWEDRINNAKLPWMRVETDGYDWKELAIIDLTPRIKKRKHRGEKEEYETLEPKKFFGVTQVSDRYTIIPNTQRAVFPAVSPDGTRVAYHEYADGSVNVVTINLDGSDKKYLTNFDDGTWMQGMDWSPDGKQLIVGIFRNFQQDLYVLNADGSGELKALNYDHWEDQDPHWTEEGIYFSSDRGGKMFNIYRMDPEAGTVHQITNVITSAQTPWITPQGHLMYATFTGHGWKNYVLARDEFYEQDVSADYALDPDNSVVQEALAFREDMSEYESMTTKFRPTKYHMHPTAVPLFRFENQSYTNLGLQAGAQLFMMDFTEDHQMFVVGYLGEDPMAAFGYTYSGWYPNINVFGYAFRSKFDYAFRIDEDNDPTTIDDQFVYDGKQHQYVYSGSLSIDYPLNDYINMEVGGRAVEFGFKQVADERFQPFLRSVTGNVDLQYLNARGTRGPNPRGRIMTLGWEHGYTDIVSVARNGVDTDDGQLMDNYQYNRIEARWTEHLPVPTFGIKGLKFVQRRNHRLQLDLHAGFIDRNVQFQDEFRAGGRHPYFWGPGALQPNTQFAGYPSALLGETMLIGSAFYRFPIATGIAKRYGPWYLKEIHMQVGGTAGNLWSFRPPEVDDVGAYYFDTFGSRVAYDSSDVRREIPFVDKAYKNGNYLLYDASIELRVSSLLLNSPWDSFIRASWAFNEITGIGDVNGDDIQEAFETGFGNAISGETEKPGPRIYVGFGTGW